jgi:hypothetical protein
VQNADDIGLGDYEDHVVILRGRMSGSDWMLEAEVVDSAGPMMTVLMVHLFGGTSG